MQTSFINRMQILYILIFAYTISLYAIFINSVFTNVKIFIFTEALLPYFSPPKKA